MKNILLLLLFYAINIFPQDTIFRYEERPIIGNIVYTDENVIIYNKNNILKDIPTEFVYSYKRDNNISILYQEDINIATSLQMDDYVMGRVQGFKDNLPGVPFTIGFFSSYFYTYYNTRGLTRNPKFSSLIFTAVPPIVFTYIKPKANKKWSLEMRYGYQTVRSQQNQVASFWGAVLGTAFMYTMYFSR